MCAGIGQLSKGVLGDWLLLEQLVIGKAGKRLEQFICPGLDVIDISVCTLYGDI